MAVILGSCSKWDSSWTRALPLAKKNGQSDEKRNLES
jgi:hypothetical protein